MSDNFYSIWYRLPLPEDKDNYTCANFKDSNIWVLKDKTGQCGLMLTGAFESMYNRYENIHLIRQDSITISKEKYDQCLIFINNDEIEVDSFAKTVSTYLDKRSAKLHYTVKDIIELLGEIENVTKLTAKNLLDVIGVWGELYVLNLLIAESSDKSHEILNGWESTLGRTIIDFNLLYAKRKVEVKTTKKRERKHHINSLEQLQKPDDWKGQLARNCVLIDEAGETCKELLTRIDNRLEANDKALLYDKIEIRGRDICNNDTIKFILNQGLSPKFINFQDVPKPLSVPGVSNLEFDITL